MSALTFAQSPKEDTVLCYKSAIKEPLTFYGNPMDTFTLYDGTKWKVVAGGAHEYIPLRHRTALIFCRLIVFCCRGLLMSQTLIAATKGSDKLRLGSAECFRACGH